MSEDEREAGEREAGVELEASEREAGEREVSVALEVSEREAVEHEAGVEFEVVDGDLAGPIAVEAEPVEVATRAEVAEEPEAEHSEAELAEAAQASEAQPSDPEPEEPPIEIVAPLVQSIAAPLELASPATPRPSPPRRPEPGTPMFVPRSPTASLVQMIRPNGAVILLGAVFLLALIEIIAAFLAYREQISREDWAELESLLAAHEDEPLLIASEWLAPRARMELAQARTWDSVAPPDLRGMTKFWVLSFGRDSWSPTLRAELEDLPMPELVAIHQVGQLTLNEYEQAAAGESLWSLVERDLEVESDAGRCSGKRRHWTCKDGRVLTRVLEVDYRPRRCLALAFDDGVSATLDLGRVELGNRLRGHVGFADFNARLRADPTVVLEAWIDEQVVARWLFTDDQGWAAFALATEPGEHQLALRISSTAAGTWQREGHRPLPTDTVCLEARGFVEAEPEPEVQ